MKHATQSPPFWHLWQSHQDHLHHQSLRLMAGNAADAEDALHAAMLRAFQGYSAQAGTLVSEKAWLSRVLHNVCMDFHRDRRRYTDTPEEPAPPAASAVPSQVEEPPDTVLLERERAREIRARIRELPANLRLPFEMRFLQDMSYEDIARQLQLTNCNARKRVQFASSLLREALADMLHAR
ncbi:RNA polymerase sigma factor [Myxococcus sp. RHST-1-4]|nr:RNA polymerase sigma factor [Myxococcus sp. RHSTA-1-4]